MISFFSLFKPTLQVGNSPHPTVVPWLTLVQSSRPVLRPYLQSRYSLMNSFPDLVSLGVMDIAWS